ncbi:hypothetical protein DIPPA_19567 [Diplonema papillatum]|nr:hypothetical protein DIPPA_19567 [Diplonema papillatum]
MKGLRICNARVRKRPAKWYCEKAIDVFEKPEEFKLTVDPETAHLQQIKKYDAYVEHMKSTFTPDRMSRRQRMINGMSEHELVRRTTEYGVWGPSIAPLNPQNRWEGLVSEVRLPARFRTARSRVARTVKWGSGVATGFSLSWILLFTSTGVWLFDYLELVAYGRDRAPEYFGMHYLSGLLPIELQDPPVFPCLIEGEPADTSERVAVVRWDRIRDEWLHRNDNLSTAGETDG